MAVIATDKPKPNPYDVNANGKVTPLDALLVIIFLNAGGQGELNPAVDPAPPPFYDVSGDNNVFPLDALLVIIALNSGMVAEGEPVADESSVIVTEGEGAAVDAELLDWLACEFWLDPAGTDRSGLGTMRQR